MGRAVLVIVVFLAVIWILVAAVWGLGVATAGIYGRGEAYKEIQSADFRIQAYQTFFNQCASIQGLEGQIDELTAILGQYEQGSREYKITLTSIAGAKGARHQAIAKYNNDAQKSWTEGQFRDKNLPYRIMDTNYPGEKGKEVGKTLCALK